MPLEKFGPSRRQHAELGEGIKVQEMTRALQSIYSKKAAGVFHHAQEIRAFLGRRRDSLMAIKQNALDGYRGHLIDSNGPLARWH